MKGCESDMPIVSDGYISSDLSSWARQGVLLLNTSLTVRAHEANSHSKRGWEQFTERVIKLVVDRLSKSGGEAGAKGVCFLAWGAGAGKLVKGISPVSPFWRSEARS
jgi:uracil-DNA glycosylase